MTCLKNKIVTIRKPRRCFTCQDSFLPGQRMIYNVGIYEGDFSDAYYCECCQKYIRDHMRYDDTWGEGDFRGEEHFEQFKKEYYENNSNR